jgi:methyl-accepting chemotaxis protein
VDEAGESVGGIVNQVQRVAALINEITTASTEQASGIGQVGEAVQQLDQVTQQNAALVEESTAAAASLRDQAAKLVAEVSVFKLADGYSSLQPAGRTSRPRTSPPPAPARARAPAAPAPRVAAERKPSLGAAPRQIAAPASVAQSKPAARDGGDDDWTTF